MIVFPGSYSMSKQKGLPVIPKYSELQVQTSKRMAIYAFIWYEKLINIQYVNNNNRICMDRKKRYSDFSK